MIKFKMPFSGFSIDPWTTQLCPRASKWLREAGLFATQVKRLEMTVLGARKGKMMWEIDVQEVSFEFIVVKQLSGKRRRLWHYLLEELVSIGGFLD